MMVMLQLSNRAKSILGRIQPAATHSRLLNLGVYQPPLIAASLKHPNSYYFLSQTKHDCKWICSTPLSLRHESKAKNRDNSRGASIAINKTTIALGLAKDWRGVLELFFKNQDKFDNINYATAMMQLARIHSLDRSDTRFLAFLDSLLENIEKRGLSWIQARSASNIIYAIGKMELINSSTNRILGWISKKDVANQFVDEAMRMGNAQGISNAVWAFATLKTEAPKLLAAIEAHSDWLVENGNAQNVANTVWAFATLKTEAPKLLAVIEAHSDWLVENGTPQGVANTAWAFATLKTEAPKLLAAIEVRSDWLVENGTPQEVANTAWSFATLKTEAPKLLAAIEAHSERLVENGTPQNVSNTAWAFATLKTEAPKLFAAIDARSEWLVENGTPQVIANTVWACATLKMDAPKLLSTIEARSDWLAENGSAQDVANTAWAFASNGFEATKFFDELNRNQMVLLRKKLNVQDVANLCFAIVIAGRVNESEVLLLKLWENAIQLHDLKAVFFDEAFLQLSQTQVFASAWGVELAACPQQMNHSMEEALNIQSAEDNTISRSSKQVSNILKGIGFDHECEVPPERNMGGMMAIDFACAKRKVAIEYDGESHFLKAVGSGELTRKRNGSTKAKRRLLEQIGWTVINLDSRDYQESSRKSKQKEWLRVELKHAGVVFPSSK